MVNEKENVVSFGVGVELREHKFILDFLSKIDLVGSMAYLPITIHDASTSQEDYVEYLYRFIESEFAFLQETIVESNPKAWKYAAASLREQLAKSPNLIRFTILLSGEESELHELVMIWDSVLEAYTLIAYNFNNDSLVALATTEYLNPEIEGFQPTEPIVVRLS